MDFYILRHAESTANAYFDHETRNVPLTDRGVRQAEAKTGHFDVVFCSPMRRTRQTLEKSKITYGELIIASEAREIVSDPCDMLTDDEEPDGFNESRESVSERARQMREKIIRVRKSGKSVLVVTHWNFVWHFTESYCDEMYDLHNAQLVHVTLSASASITTMDVYFLRHAQSTANAYGDIDTRNVPLTDEGKAQAKAVKGHFNTVLCSPLRRTRQTLETSKITYDKLLIVPEAREIIDVPCDMMTDDEETDDYRESTEHKKMRCKILHDKIKNVVKEAPSQKVLIVSHWKFIAYFTLMFADSSYHFKNAQLMKISLKQ